MSDPVDSDKIEEIVGVKRHQRAHWARAVSAEERVYLLHSQNCMEDYGDDLRACPYSQALDEGIDSEQWMMDTPVVVSIKNGRLIEGSLALGDTSAEQSQNLD